MREDLSKPERVDAAETAPTSVPLRKMRHSPDRQAKLAGLRYINDGAKGLTRQKHGKSFRYLKADGSPVRDDATLARIRKLAIPPAWEQVWICATANGHLQATGRDAKGRKQYRYHADFRGHCERDKFARMAAFAKVLPIIRAQIAEDMSRRGLPREKVLATIVSLLESTLIRVGNEDYARQNGSYGISTLRDRHTQIDGSEVVFKFMGKSGKPWRVTLRDPRVARIVKACQDLPGQRLFQYLDEAGKVQRVTSNDVNAYLRQLSGADITAKDFRTWSGTVMAALVLKEIGRANSETEAKRAIRDALTTVSGRLGNTPTICRKCYVHPAVFARHLAGDLLRVRKTAANTPQVPALSPEERAVLGLITRSKPLKLAA